MNKIKIIISLLFFSAICGHAQIANWKVMPEYQSIVPLENRLVKICQNNRFGLLDHHAELILPIEYDSISDFTNGVALLYKDGKFDGIVDQNGNLANVSGKGYSLIPNMKFFSDGFLPVKKDDGFYFINPKGSIVAGPMADIKPYFSGYAAGRYYIDREKKPSETYVGYMDAEQKLVNIPLVNKHEDLSFISSFRDGDAFCIYKKKGYRLDKDLSAYSLSIDSVTTKKSLVSFDKDLAFTPIQGGYLLNGKNAFIYFNDLLQVDSIISPNGLLYAYQIPETEEYKISSDFKVFGNAGKYGLEYVKQVLLPEQFDDVVLMNGPYAIVKSDGKWGILTVDPHNQISFKLNNNEHIGFNHQYYTAKLSASLPSYIKSRNATIYSKSDNCEIQVESRHENDNVERNTLTYDCRLSIPKELTDTLSVQDYIFTLKYDGLNSVDYKVSVPEWYVKYYEVELSNTKFTLAANDTITVEFDLVKTDVARNDETNYFKTVELITPNAEDIPLTKITENHYSFRVGSGNLDKLSFIIKITETGCPSIEYPFEMVFARPEPKSKNKSVNVTVNAVRRQAKPKQTPVAPTSTPIFIPK